VKSIEVYRERLILYGCGDFLTDYEGITGYEMFRSDLALMYLPKINSRDGRLLELRLVPMQMRCFQLQHASATDAKWLCPLLNELGTPFRTQFELAGDNSIQLRQEIS
jgi:poly-gamma-glutamate capsule biosynthesis protein CapA/YwtB (metallophosphatase superfamily)